jgi:hypothetical protein
MAIRRTMRTIQTQVGTVILSWEAGRLYAEWMAGGGVEPSGLQGPGPAPLLSGLGSPREGKTSLKGTPCRNKLASRKTPTPQSVLRSSLTTGSTRSGPGGGVEPSDASIASVSGGFGFGVDLVLAVPADEAAAIA